MRWFCIYKGMKGIWKLNDLYLRNEYIITEEARKRGEIVNFFNRYGPEATKDAFDICRSTVFRWKQLLVLFNGRLDALNSQSRAPHKKSVSKVDSRIIEYIRQARKQYPKLSKTKMKPILDSYCTQNNLNTVSVSTIGRVINKYKMYYCIRRNKTNKRISRKNKLRRGNYQPQNPGDLWQIDTVVKFDFAVKRYIISAIELKTRFAFSYCYKNPSSSNAKDFIQKLEKVAPFPVKRVQTDNGSEFDLHFHQYIEETGRIHYFNYPKSPKMNAFIERYNGILQQEFIDVKDVDPYNDIDSFNNQLMDYLLFYNTQRIHQGILNMTPLMFFLYLLKSKKSNMLWTRTKYCKQIAIILQLK